MNNLEILSEISNTKSIIQRYTMAGVLDKTDSNHILCQKITNAALTLYINAYRLAAGKTPFLTTTPTPLLLENIKTLMGEICNTLSKPLFAEEMETHIIQLLRKYSLNPEELFVENTPDDVESVRAQKILNGN